LAGGRRVVIEDAAVLADDMAAAGVEGA